jgi:hypothetical protein
MSTPASSPQSNQTVPSEPITIKPNGQDLPPPDEAAPEADETRPVVEELPEEQDAPQPIRPAAAAEKFKKFGAMRRDPQASLVPVRKRLTAIPPRTPNKEWFVRTSRHPDHNGILPLYWDKSGDGHPYLIDETVQDFFGEAVRNNYCVLSCTRQLVYFLWCSPLEGPDGDWNTWHSSAHDMKGFAAESWIRVKSNKQLAGYEVVDPIGAPPPDPVWPDISWEDIVRLAFRRHLVETENHPLINRLLRG